MDILLHFCLFYKNLFCSFFVKWVQNAKNIINNNNYEESIVSLFSSQTDFKNGNAFFSIGWKIILSKKA